MKEIMEVEVRDSRKTLIGVVVSNAMEKTCVVAIKSNVRHPIYNKIVKKTKKFTKAHLTLAIMVIALAAAVGLNMKYSADMGNSDTSSKYLGQAEYVNASAEEESDQSKESDYFKNLRKERKSARDEALDIIEETLDRTDLTENERNPKESF